MKFISLGGINWAWYAGLTAINHADKTVTIGIYDRLHRERDSAHPETIAAGETIENEEREIVGMRIQGMDYLVTNPQRSYATF